MRRIIQFNFNWNGKPTGKVQIYARTWKEAHATMEKHNCSMHHFRAYAMDGGSALLGRDGTEIVLGASVTMEEVEKEFPRS
jgi:hypothetical protein